MKNALLMETSQGLKSQEHLSMLMLGFSKDSPDSFFDVFNAGFQIQRIGPKLPFTLAENGCEMVAQNGLRRRACRLEIGSICCQINKLFEVMGKGHMYDIYIYTYIHIR